MKNAIVAILNIFGQFEKCWLHEIGVFGDIFGSYLPEMSGNDILLLALPPWETTEACVVAWTAAAWAAAAAAAAAAWEGFRAGLAAATGTAAASDVRSLKYEIVVLFSKCYALLMEFYY